MLRMIIIVPTKQIIPLINGNKYKKEYSIATLVVTIKICNKDWLENQDKNCDNINNIEPVNPNNRKSKYLLISIIYQFEYVFYEYIQIV
jgi:hypothetical protein